MRVMLASEAGRRDVTNEDWAGATATGTAVLLDGLTEGGPTGCVHGTAWYVHQLGTRLLTHAGDPALPLVEALAAAIVDVSDLHGDRCDLSHPGAPAAAVAMLRPRGGRLEYLVLADTVAVFDTGADPLVVTDQSVRGHLAELAEAAKAGPPDALSALIAAQRQIRNRPGGYWVAQLDPQAARHALTGAVDRVTGALLLSDGAAASVTDFAAVTWPELLEVAYRRGPAEVVALTRELEHGDADRVVWPRYKVHDDATVVVFQM